MYITFIKAQVSNVWKPTRFTFLIERADGEIGTISSVSENLLIFFSQLDNKIFLATFLMILFL